MAELTEHEAEMATNAAASTTVIQSGYEEFMVVPKGYILQSVEHLRDEPKRIVETISLSTKDSFIGYVNNFKGEKTSIMADVNLQKITASIDYHRRDTPSRSTHKAIYECSKSRQFESWLSKNDSWLSQIDFANFVEDNIAHLRNPAGAAMLELITKFNQTKKSAFSSNVRLNNGMVQLSYSEDEDKGNFEMPEMFVLAIPIFQNGVTYSVNARIRTDIREQKLFFKYKLVDSQSYVEQAFTEVCNELIAQLSDIPFYLTE